MADTRTSVKDGLWSDASVWGGSGPVDGDTAIVAHQVEFDVDMTAYAAGVRMTINAGAQLFCTTTPGAYALKLGVGNAAINGTLRAGTSALSPLPANVLFDVLLNGRQLTVHSTTGRVLMYCTRPTVISAALTATASTGSPVLQVDTDCTSWLAYSRLTATIVGALRTTSSLSAAGVTILTATPTTITLTANSPAAFNIDSKIIIRYRNIRMLQALNGTSISGGLQLYLDCEFTNTAAGTSSYYVAGSLDTTIAGIIWGIGTAGYVFGTGTNVVLSAGSVIAWAGANTCRMSAANTIQFGGLIAAMSPFYSTSSGLPSFVAGAVFIGCASAMANANGIVIPAGVTFVGNGLVYQGLNIVSHATHLRNFTVISGGTNFTIGADAVLDGNRILMTVTASSLPFGHTILCNSTNCGAASVYHVYGAASCRFFGGFSGWGLAFGACADCELHDASFSGFTTDLINCGNMVLHNCMLSSGALYSATAGLLPPIMVQSFDDGGVAGAERWWMPGGVGVTEARAGTPFPVTRKLTAGSASVACHWQKTLLLEANEELVLWVWLDRNAADAAFSVLPTVQLLDAFHDPLLISEASPLVERVVATPSGTWDVARLRYYAATDMRVIVRVFATANIGTETYFVVKRELSRDRKVALA